MWPSPLLPPLSPTSFLSVPWNIATSFLISLPVTILLLTTPILCCHLLLLFSQSCPTLCDPMDCSASDFSVLHYFLEFAQTHVHWVDDAIQPSHSLSPTSPPAINLSQHQGLFQWVSSLHQLVKAASASVLPMNIQGSFPLGLTGLISLVSKGLSRVFSAPQFKSINSSVLSPPDSPTSHIIHDYWKNHSFDYTDLCQQRIRCLGPS